MREPRTDQGMSDNDGPQGRSRWLPKCDRLGRLALAPGRRVWLLAGAGTVALALLAGALALPRPGLPPPTGSSQVGATTLELPAMPGERRLILYIWYPATLESGLHRAAYREQPGWLRRSRLVTTRAWRNAPVAPGRHAVVLYAYGWDGFAQENTALMEDLASHGFTVVAVGSPDHLGILRSPDRKTSNLDGPLDLGSDEAAATTLAIGTYNVETRAKELQRALDALAALNTSDPTGKFHGRLRIDRVGALGFSFGGAVAAEASRLDARIGAVMNMDGWLFGPVQRDGVAVPYLVFSDDSPLPASDDATSDDAARRNFALVMGRDWDLMRRNFARHGGDYLTLKGAIHADFSDQSLLSWRLRRLDAIAPSRASTIVRAYAVAFFGHWLRGDPPGVLAGADAPYPEVRREGWALPPSPGQHPDPTNDTTKSERN
jgi:dienelactone hydrolase